jgi:hypothetical protein
MHPTQPLSSLQRSVWTDRMQRFESVVLQAPRTATSAYRVGVALPGRSYRVAELYRVLCAMRIEGRSDRARIGQRLCCQFQSGSAPPD